MKHKHATTCNDVYGHSRAVQMAWILSASSNVTISPRSHSSATRATMSSAPGCKIVRRYWPYAESVHINTRSRRVRFTVLEVAAAHAQHDGLLGLAVGLGHALERVRDDPHPHAKSVLELGHRHRLLV